MTWPWVKQNCVLHWPSFKHCTVQNVANGDAVTGLTVCGLRKSPERGLWLKGKFRCYGEINSIQKLFDHATYSLFRSQNDFLCQIQSRHVLHYLIDYVVVWERFSLILFTVKTLWSQHIVCFVVRVRVVISLSLETMWPHHTVYQWCVRSYYIVHSF
jgi:hypothetical protein